MVRAAEVDNQICQSLRLDASAWERFLDHVPQTQAFPGAKAGHVSEGSRLNNIHRISGISLLQCQELTAMKD